MNSRIIMASVNKVIIVGNLGRDPDMRSMDGGEAIANIPVATSHKWKDRDSGEIREQTEWHRVVFFSRLAEIAGQYLKKGSSVYIEGRLHTRKYTDKDGVERYATDIVAEQMQMLGGPNGSSREANEKSTYEQAPEVLAGGLPTPRRANRGAKAAKRSPQDLAAGAEAPT